MKKKQSITTEKEGIRGIDLAKTIPIPNSNATLTAGYCSNGNLYADLLFTHGKTSSKPIPYRIFSKY
jgi:hypothetical protein